MPALNYDHINEITRQNSIEYHNMLNIEKLC